MEHERVRSEARPRWRLVSVAVATALLPAALLTAEAPGSALVSMADGGSVLLRSWTLSVEYQAWPSGTSQYQAPIARRETTDLWLGRRSYPLAGATLEIEYAPAEREREVDGSVRKVAVPTARGLALTGPDGKRTPLRLEAPQRDLVVPGAPKSQMLLVRTLDLRGETLAGTHGDLCIASFTALVECPDEDARRIVRIEFRPPTKE
jgi:hypothetical protein